MKKTYINPEIEIVKIASQMQMLGGKGETARPAKQDAPFTNDKLDDIPW